MHKRKISRLTEAKSLIKRMNEHLTKSQAESVTNEQYDNDNLLYGKLDINCLDSEGLEKDYDKIIIHPLSTTFYGNKLTDASPLKEAVGDIMPPDVVVSEIRKLFHLPEAYVYKLEHFHKIYVYIIIPEKVEDYEPIKETMEKMGYFLSQDNEKFATNGRRYRVLQFEPTSQLQDDETDSIKHENNKLYHWTPEYNVENILKNGLIPSHKNRVFNYPSRTYLMSDKYSQQEIFGLGQQLCIHSSDPQNTGTYGLLVIDVKNLPENIRLYLDPNSLIGIYTEQEIPSQYIHFVQYIQFVQNLTIKE